MDQGVKAATTREHACSGNSAPVRCAIRVAMARIAPMPKPSPTVVPLLFEVDPQPLEETLNGPGRDPAGGASVFVPWGLPGKRAATRGR